MSPAARSGDPVTSHAAARSVKNVSITQAAVLSIIRDKGPLTDVGLANWWRIERNEPISDSGLRTRRKELVERGLVEDSGTFATLTSGRDAIRWQVRENNNGREN